MMGLSHSFYEHELESLKAAGRVLNNTDISTEDPKGLVQKYQGVYSNAIGKAFPTGIIYLP